MLCNKRCFAYIMAICIFTLLIGCTKKYSPQDLLQADYYDWSTCQAREKITFIWDDQTFYEVDAETIDLNTYSFRIIEEGCGVYWNKNQNQYVIERGADSKAGYYILCSEEDIPLVLLIPNQKMIKKGIFGESPRPLAFCLSRDQSAKGQSISQSRAGSLIDD